jgi:transcriptional regulator with XRE-family HTH domain
VGNVTKSVFSERYERFRQLIIKCRKAKGITQVELANMLSRPQSFVSKYERGERRLDVIEFLDVANALGIKPADFLRELADSPSKKLSKRSS